MNNGFDPTIANFPNTAGSGSVQLGNNNNNDAPGGATGNQQTGAGQPQQSRDSVQTGLNPHTLMLAAEAVLELAAENAQQNQGPQIVLGGNNQDPILKLAAEAELLALLEEADGGSPQQDPLLLLAEIELSGHHHNNQNIKLLDAILGEELAMMLDGGDGGNGGGGGGAVLNLGGGSGNSQGLLRHLENSVANSGSNSSSSSNGSASGGQNVNSFDIKSEGDPHIHTSIDGGSSQKIDDMNSIPNLLTVNDTFGGPTQVNTVASPSNSDGKTYNQSVGIHNSDWGFEANNNNGSTSAVITDGNSQQTLNQGGTINEADGSVFAMDNSGKITVTQATKDGGTVTSTVTNNGKGLDIDVTGKGNAQISGMAADGYSGGSSSSSSSSGG